MNLELFILLIFVLGLVTTVFSVLSWREARGTRGDQKAFLAKVGVHINEKLEELGNFSTNAKDSIEKFSTRFNEVREANNRVSNQITELNEFLIRFKSENQNSINAKIEDLQNILVETIKLSSNTQIDLYKNNTAELTKKLEKNHDGAVEILKSIIESISAMDKNVGDNVAKRFGEKLLQALSTEAPTKSS